MSFKDSQEWNDKEHLSLTSIMAMVTPDLPVLAMK